MSITITGRLMNQDGQTAFHDEVGLIQAPRFLVDELTVGADIIPVDIDHDHRRIGELVWLERTAGGDINAAAVVERDELVDIDEPWFFSPALDCQQEGSGICWTGRRPVLRSVALTQQPAQLGMQRPLRIDPGDVRSSFDRSQWPCSWSLSNRVLERASKLAGTRYNQAPLRIHDLDKHGKPIVQLDDQRMPAVHRAAARRGADGLIYQTAGHLGRVLSVS